MRTSGYKPGVGMGTVLRDGKICGCGPFHGRFKYCVGSGRDGSPARPKRTKQPETPRIRTTTPFSIPEDVISARRKRTRFTKQQLADCADCGWIHEAKQYCSRHREVAVQNILRAAKTNGGITIMHLTLAEEHGIDLLA